MTHLAAGSHHLVPDLPPPRLLLLMAPLPRLMQVEIEPSLLLTVDLSPLNRLREWMAACRYMRQASKSAQHRE